MRGKCDGMLSVFGLSLQLKCDFIAQVTYSIVELEEAGTRRFTQLLHHLTCVWNEKSVQRLLQAEEGTSQCISGNALPSVVCIVEIAS